MPAIICKQEANVAYALIERLVSFPADVLANYVPLQYKLSQAHARSTSIHPGCAHAHTMTLASSRLRAVKMSYSDIVGVFSNLRMLITGTFRDGKSILLWLDTMIMHMYCMRDYKLAMEQYEKGLKTYKDDLAEPLPLRKTEPQKTKEIDETYDAGSTVGPGQMMRSTSGRAVWLEHEARKLLKNLMQGGASGSFDEINQAGNAYHRNSPANDNSKFSIEKPHLVTIWLVHLEELVSCFRAKNKRDASEEGDSVAVLARFFIAYFPCGH